MERRRGQGQGRGRQAVKLSDSQRVIWLVLNLFVVCLFYVALLAVGLDGLYRFLLYSVGNHKHGLSNCV
jgi:hypothetical protein